MNVFWNGPSSRIKSYKTFELDQDSLRELIAEYYCNYLNKDNLKSQLLTGLHLPFKCLNELPLETLIEVAKRISLAEHIEKTLLENDLISVQEKIRIVVRDVKNVLYDLREIEDVIRNHNQYSNVLFPAIKFIDKKISEIDN